MTDAERRVYESTSIPLAFYSLRDGKGVTDLVSDGFCRLMGEARSHLMELMNRGMFDRVHPDDAGRLASIGGHFIQKKCNYDVLFRGRCNENGDYHCIHTVGCWQTMADGTEEAVLVYTDMTESMPEIRTLELGYEALQKDKLYSDPITGLPNLNFLKQFADQRINTLWASGITPAILYCDIRSMAAYNTEYGYARGDELVQLTGRVLRARFPDALLARGEVDHFILITEYNEDIGKRVLKANAQIKREAYGSTTGLQCAIVRMLPELRAIEGIDRARSTMKEIGDDLNIVYRLYSHGEDTDYWMGRYVLQNFDTALEKGWIKVFYQPILRTRTEKVTILEGLARWVDPVQGLISPGQFIPVLSRYHLLHKLDVFMVEQICREFKVREDAGLPLIPVTVNFSAQDFDYVDIVEVLNRSLEQYGLDHNSIIIEITEQDLAMATDHFREQLSRIHENGYKLWVDDFGSGYSSLNVFSQYHVDRVKFDMDFVRHLDDNHGTNRIILKYMVEMCREMGVHTLAEGVETKEQYEFLSEIDCAMVQGFYMYKPEPVEMSIFKIQNTGAIVPIEAHNERNEMCDRWLMKGKF